MLATATLCRSEGTAVCHNLNWTGWHSYSGQSPVEQCTDIGHSLSDHIFSRCIIFYVQSLFETNCQFFFIFSFSSSQSTPDSQQKQSKSVSFKTMDKTKYEPGRIVFRISGTFHAVIKIVLQLCHRLADGVFRTCSD